MMIYPCGLFHPDCMRTHIEDDADGGDEEADKVLDCEPDAICEDCPQYPSE